MSLHSKSHCSYQAVRAALMPLPCPGFISKMTNPFQVKFSWMFRCPGPQLRIQHSARTQPVWSISEREQGRNKRQKSRQPDWTGGSDDDFTKLINSKSISMGASGHCWDLSHTIKHSKKKKLKVQWSRNPGYQNSPHQECLKLHWKKAYYHSTPAHQQRLLSHRYRNLVPVVNITT